MKFCNLKPQNFVLFFQSLSENHVLSSLDISENSLGEEGAQSFLKLLNTNTSLNYLVSEKAQAPLRMKK